MAEDTHFWYGFNYTAEGWAQVSLLVIIRSKSVVNCNANVEANSIIRRPPIDISQLVVRVSTVSFSFLCGAENIFDCIDHRRDYCKLIFMFCYESSSRCSFFK